MDEIECPKCGLLTDADSSPEEERGERTCEQCGFQFIVEVEYDPVYWTTCKTHEYQENPNHGQHACKWCGCVKPEEVSDE